MIIRWLLLGGAVLFAGCVPVTEPLTDIEKSEPDKALLGKWSDPKNKSTFVVDIPEVKGNPKGLMRATFSQVNVPPEEYWFFVARVGKADYIQMLVERRVDSKLSFAKEGAFAAWQKSDVRGYWIGKYAFDKDSLTIDGGRAETFKAIMKREKFAGSKHDYTTFFATPAGWLAKHIEKNGPDEIFDGKGEVLRYERIK